MEIRNADLSARHLPSTMAGVTATGDMIISFEWVKVTLTNADPSKNGKVENRLMIHKQPVGDRQTKSSNYIDPKKAAEQYPLEFSHFEDTGEVPTSGTPLSELPGISKSQVSLMQVNSVRSIEDVLMIGQDRMATVAGYTGQQIYNLAKMWDDKRRGSTDVIQMAEMQAAHDTMLQTLEARLAAMEKANEQLTAQNAALQQMQGQPVTVDKPIAVINEESSDLPTAVEDMPDVLSGGDDYGDASEDLSVAEPDPLA